MRATDEGVGVHIIDIPEDIDLMPTLYRDEKTRIHSLERALCDLIRNTGHANDAREWLLTNLANIGAKVDDWKEPMETGR